MPRAKKASRVGSLKDIRTSDGPIAPEVFVRAVSKALVPIADPTLRPWMKAYMKNQFEFLGVATPARRLSLSGLIRMQKGTTAAHLLRSARLLWTFPEREYQYVAVDLLAKHVRALTPKQLPALFNLVQKRLGGTRSIQWLLA